MKVLIVDDDVDFAQTLGQLLALAGYDIETALNGRDGIAIQRRFLAPVIILDIFMPLMDGFETIETLRKEFPDTRVIVMSGSGKLNSASYLRAAGLLGTDLALNKPFEMDVLLEKLESLKKSLPDSLSPTGPLKKTGPDKAL